MTQKIWELRNVSPTAKFVLLSMQRHAASNGVCPFSSHRICDDTGFNERTVRNALRELENEGHITGFRDRDPDGFARRYFRIHPANEPLIPAEDERIYDAEVCNLERKGLAQCSVIYCIQQGESGPIKIGYSTALNSRLRSLQSACAYPLRVLWTKPGDSHQERRLHDELRDFRLSGEWFRPEAKARLVELGVPA